MFIRLFIFSLAFSCVFLCSAEDKEQKDKEKLSADTLAKMTYKELENNGVDYLLAEKFDLSQACFEEMLKREKAKANPSNVELAIIYYGLGRVFQDKEEFPEAIKYFNKALKLVKNKDIDKRFIAQLYYYTGAAYSRNGELDKAMELEQQAIALAKIAFGKNHSKPAVYLAGNANIYRKKQQYNLALKQLKEAQLILMKKPKKNKNILEKIAQKILQVEKEAKEASLNNSF